MATIRPADLPAAASVSAADVLIVDKGSTVEKATPAQILDAAAPLASQAEAEAGADNAKRVTPLRVKQAIDTLGVSAANLASADSGLGADLVGTTGGGTVQDALDIVQTGSGKAAIGTTVGASRLTLLTTTAFAGNSQDIYHYAQQAVSDNQTIAQVIHNYTNGKSLVIDTVGNKVSLSLKQAYNDVARPGFGVGTGDFFELMRARPAGGGVWPNGNIGGNNDKLTWGNPFGNLCFYGSDAQDWTGDDTKAPIQIGTYENFLNRKGYLGYRNDLNALVIGAIDTDAGDFRQIFFGASALVPLGDADSSDPTGVGAASLRFTTGHFEEVCFGGDGADVYPRGASLRTCIGTPEGAVSGNIGDICTRLDGGAGTTLYVKESGTGTVNGWAAK